MQEQYTECVVYEYCKNKIEIIYMIIKYHVGEEYVSYCGYTGDENHYIFLGKF